MKIFAQNLVTQQHDIHFEDIVYTVNGKDGKCFGIFKVYRLCL